MRQATPAARAGRVPPLTRRSAMRGFGAGILTSLLAASGAGGQLAAPTYVRIATGASGGGYFRIGGLIGNAISKPPGAPACTPSPSSPCGVPGLIALTQATFGSVDNILAVEERRVELALAQADVVDSAVAGRGRFAETGPTGNVRAIASLYTESLHLIVRADSDIAEIGDLRGHRVGLDMPGSGTGVIAEAVLEAFGLPLDVLTPHRARPNEAMDMLVAGSLDATFMMAGYPVISVLQAADAGSIRLLPVEGPELDGLLANHPYFGIGVIPADAYADTAEMPTVTVRALLVVGAHLDEDLVYEITRALWHPNATRLIAEGHPRGKELSLERAIEDLPVALHPGAARFYDDAGLLARETGPGARAATSPAEDAPPEQAKPADDPIPE